MNTLSDQEIEKTYLSYLQEARALQKDSVRQVSAYLVLALVFMCGGASSIFWAGYRTMANLIFWGIVLGLIIELVGIIKQDRWMKEHAAHIARTKPGFVEFSKLFRRGQWPKQMVSGKKYEQFLAIAGLQKSSVGG